MNERPVRLIVSDDLLRGRGSVFFRALFALPFFLWLAVWALAAFFVAIVNWVATLVRGRSPERLHGFLARFVRYTTHAYAYLFLAAEPLPNFDGRPGYPIDLEIDSPARQNRWTVAFRIVLAVPALLIANVLVGYGAYTSQVAESGGIGLLVVAAFLGWFVALARARMPRGLRDAIAYALSYGAQLWAYLLLLTDRYPSSDPLSAIGPLPARDDPIQLDVRGEMRRSRLTVFFRLLLSLPHLVWLTLWAIAAYLGSIVNWFATLFAGQSPDALHRFLAAYVRYQSHVYAYLFMIANPFPGFTGRAGSYPVDPVIAGRRAQNRWKVLFRLILVLPALLIASTYGALLFVVALLAWFTCLFMAKMPPGLRNAGALTLRYAAQTSGYLLLVTDGYPYTGPTAPAPAPAETSPSPFSSPA